MIAAKQRNMMLTYNYYLMRRPCVLLPLLAIILNRKTEARIVINQKTEVKDEFSEKEVKDEKMRRVTSFSLSPDKKR